MQHFPISEIFWLSFYLFFGWRELGDIFWSLELEIQNMFLSKYVRNIVSLFILFFGKRNVWNITRFSEKSSYIMCLPKSTLQQNWEFWTPYISFQQSHLTFPFSQGQMVTKYSRKSRKYYPCITHHKQNIRISFFGGA